VEKIERITPVISGGIVDAAFIEAGQKQFLSFAGDRHLQFVQGVWPESDIGHSARHGIFSNFFRRKSCGWFMMPETILNLAV
jgi:hypothetical protein